MKRAYFFLVAYIVSVGIANAAVRDNNTVSRAGKKLDTGVTSRTNVVSRASTNRSSTSHTVAARTATTSPRGTTARTASTPIRNSRSTKQTNVRTDTPSRSTTSASTARTTANKSRATIQTNTFGTGYNQCRDAYFTCMDQFCATQNDTYRRCVCSSRLSQIKSRENLLSDTADQLQDFKDFNLNVIDKSAVEVSAMISASAGETASSFASDTSESAQQLANISSVLNKAKSQSLSTAGILDIGGNIQQIWQTTNLADGANIANLTGEALYNAVHAQCTQLVADTCDSRSTLNMVVSAYGMYIENDCTALSNSLDSKITKAKGSVRETEREMHSARLENYNTHNATPIHDCIANVRTDLTAETACGPDYIHCLDITGRYLNRETGEPIYTANFYQLDGQISLSGDILTNQTNRIIVAELNRMRNFAKSSLDTCRDLADEVWDEFVRQAVTEIYQGQQQAIRNVKNDCLNVVNACYDEQNQSLKDFSNVKEQLLLGQRLELSEELCREKLEACSNLYGGGANGLKELVNTMKDLTDSKIAKECRISLQEFAYDMCTVPSNDTLHAYPYACRVYAPGEQKYAQYNACNQQLWKSDTNSGNQTFIPPEDDKTLNYICPISTKYTSCAVGYYMTKEGQYNGTPQAGNKCTPCPNGYYCPGGLEDRIEQTTTPEGLDCGDYPGSLYQRLVRYALQSCVRPSDANNTEYSISIDVLQDVNTVMDTIRVDMGVALAAECERLGGTWVDTMWVDKESDGKHDITQESVYQSFYDETGANKSWGYCTKKN